MPVVAPAPVVVPPPVVNPIPPPVVDQPPPPAAPIPPPANVNPVPPGPDFVRNQYQRILNHPNLRNYNSEFAKTALSKLQTPDAVDEWVNRITTKALKINIADDDIPLSKHYKTLYQALYAAKDMAVGKSGGEKAFHELKTAQAKIADILTEPDFLADWGAAQEANHTRLKNMFLDLQTEIETMQATTSAKTHFQYSSSREYNVNTINKTKAQFDEWKMEQQNRIPSHVENVVLANNTDQRITANRDMAHDDVYRCFPPQNEPSTNKSVYYEHESQRNADGSHKNYELVVLDLPDSISDRGLFIKFLKKYNPNFRDAAPPYQNTENSITRNLARFNALVYQLPPVLSKNTVLNFLETKIYIPRRETLSSNESIAEKLLDYLDHSKRRVQKVELHRQTMWNESVEIPSLPVFFEAARILKSLIASDQSSIYIHHVKNKHLAIALDCLLETDSTLKEKIKLPDDAPHASQKQKQVMTQRHYQFINGKREEYYGFKIENLVNLSEKIDAIHNAPDASFGHSKQDTVQLKQGETSKPYKLL